MQINPRERQIERNNFQDGYHESFDLSYSPENFDLVNPDFAQIRSTGV